MTALATTTPADVMRRHPCYNNEAHDRVGRMHLAVAPRCNIQCDFCERRTCANLTMQHPGWTATVLSPVAALEHARSVMRRADGRDIVIGVAGPGDPLANDETFETLAAVHREYPDVLKCASTNGLLLEDRLQDLLYAGLQAITVTVNAPDADVGRHVYSRVRYRGRTHRGEAAAALLIEKQLRGIEAALAAGLAVKVNTVLIPGVNDHHLVRLAERVRNLGVRMMNVMPLLPAGRMKHLRPPTCEELRAARRECEAVLPQFRRCEQCRADIVYLPSKARRATPV
jgi:nitrogen fixation protein NifB